MRDEGGAASDKTELQMFDPAYPDKGKRTFLWSDEVCCNCCRTLYRVAHVCVVCCSVLQFCAARCSDVSATRCTKLLHMNWPPNLYFQELND